MKDFNELLQVGYEHRQPGHHEQAAKFHREATQLPEAQYQAFFNLGNALYSRGRWWEAVTEFNEALARNPDLHGAHLQLARCEVALGNIPKARHHLAEVLRANPGNFNAWFEAGNVSRKQSEYGQALNAYSKAAEVAPSRWESHFAVARTFEELGRPEEAAGAYQRTAAAADSADTALRQMRNSPDSDAGA